MRPSFLIIPIASLSILFGTSIARAAEVVSMGRYILEAGPVQVGVVAPLDHALMQSLCRDKDGCEVILQMVNWDNAQPGNVASLTARLFLSESSNWWRFADLDDAGEDGNSILELGLSVDDCKFTDIEAGTGSTFQDINPGWGLYNSPFGNSDATTTCRVVLID